MRDISPLLFVGTRLALASIVLVILSWLLKQSFHALRGKYIELILAGVFLHGLSVSAFHLGMLSVNAAVMALVQAATPILIAIAGWALLRQRLRPIQWCGVAIGAVGAAIVLVPKTSHSEDVLLGVVFGGAGALSLAAGTLLFSRLGRSDPQSVPLFPATAIQLASGAAVALVGMCVLEEPFFRFTNGAIVSFAWNLGLVSIGGMLLYYLMLQRGKAGQVATNFYLVPGTTALLAWLWAGETLSASSIGGLLLASVGVFLAAREDKAESSRS